MGAVDGAPSGGAVRRGAGAFTAASLKTAALPRHQAQASIT